MDVVLCNTVSWENVVCVKRCCSSVLPCCNCGTLSGVDSVVLRCSCMCTTLSKTGRVVLRCGCISVTLSAADRVVLKYGCMSRT